MAITTKNNGAYTAPVGVFVKKGGVYAAAQGMYAKVAGVYQAALTSVVVPMSLAVRARSSGAALTITPASDAAANTVYTVTSTQGSLIDFSAGTGALNRFLGNMVDGTQYPLTVTASSGGTTTGTATISVTPTTAAVTKTTVTDQIEVWPTSVVGTFAGTSTQYIDPNRIRTIFKAPATNIESVDIAPNSNGNENTNGVWTEIYTVAPGQEIEIVGDNRRIMSRPSNGSTLTTQKLIIETEITL
jgi:hypothetical protein